jgi:putative FmdB family regulatory protein
VPIYEYQCTKCGEVFEAFQKITDEPLTNCKFCHAKVEKLISQSSFQLKGSGWYLTDYARRSSSNSTDKSKAGDSSGKALETKASTETKSSDKSSESKT